MVLFTGDFDFLAAAEKAAEKVVVEKAAAEKVAAEKSTAEIIELRDGLILEPAQVGLACRHLHATTACSPRI